MKSYVAFIKKEFMENTRTYKLLMMLLIFIGLGIMSPLTAKLTPQLFEMFVPEGIVMEVPEPTAIDSWMQFHKNISQLGFIILVTIFSGALTNEFSRGTLIIVLTKGLSRKTVIFAKFTAIVAIWTLSYVLSFITTYLYTAYYWSGDDVSNILFAAFCLWLFGVLLISILMLGNVLINNSFGPLLFTGTIFIVLLMLNMFTKIQSFNPLRLVTGNVPLLINELAVTDFYVALGVTVVCSVICLWSTVTLFNKKQL